MIGQEKERYYDASGKLIWEQNPALRSAWDHAVQAADAGLSAKLDQWSPQWNQAFSAGSFATMPCPAWMLGYIRPGRRGRQGQVGRGRAARRRRQLGRLVPGRAEGREAQEGGVRADQVAHRPRAADQALPEAGQLPSATGAIEKVADAKDPFFSNAPIGKIFGDAAKEAPVQVLGVHDQNIAQQITNALSEVERKGTAPEKAWSNAKKGVENTIG